MAEEVLTTQAGDEGKRRIRGNTVGTTCEVEENNIPSRSTDGARTAETPSNSQPNSPTFNSSQALKTDASSPSTTTTTSTTTTATQEGEGTVKPLNASLEMVNRANLGRRGSSPDFTGNTNNNNGWKETTSNGDASERKKSKWGLLGWIKKELKIKGSDTENGKAGSLREKGNAKAFPMDKTLSSPAIPSTSMGNDKSTPNPEKEPEQTESEANARKVIVVQTIEDFPDECQKWIKQCGIPREKLEANFKILMNVLHFRSGKIFKTPDMLNDPPRPILPKSQRIKKGEELVTDAAEFKKLYRDMEELGKGGFGVVFHARMTKDKKRPVAIKRMEHKTKKQKLANFHEASILSFCHHPNIVKYFTCHEIKEELWVVMELMEGGTFEDAAKAWHFSESNIAYIARELLKGIAYMHQNQLAHRDLKSANIMMSVRGEVKIIDLGLCADLSVGFPTHMVGSPFWMPPEMIQCKAHNYAVDIWSFAISLLEIANQRPPMIESAVKAMFTVGTEGVKELFVDPSKWSDSFKDFLGLCLKVDPEERATAETLLGHPFLKLADTRANMENILRRIFLSNSLLNSGF